MLDKKTTAVLKVLGRLGEDCAYKVITVEEILSSLSSRNQYDVDSVKQIIEFLRKQEYIVLKFEEDSTFVIHCFLKLEFIWSKIIRMLNLKSNACRMRG
jgi:hypothetical protein